MPERWYVVQTKYNQEQLAFRELRNQNFEAFSPSYLRVTTKNGRVVKTVRPLYPTYIFVKFDIEACRWRSINGTRGVSGIVASTEESASPIPVGFVENLIGTLNKSGFIDLQETVKTMLNYAKGTRLEIKDNAFNGLVGECEKSAGGRVTLFLTLLSRKVRLSLPISSVEPAFSGT